MPLSMCFILLGIVFLEGTTSTTVSDLDTSQELAIDDLKDLLMTSIQNTIALNDLVTQLTQKIVNTMITVGETTSKIEELEKTFNKGMEDVRAEIKENSEVVFQSLNEKLESLKNNSNSGLLTLNEKVESLKNISNSGLLTLNDKLESLNSSSETKNQQFEEKMTVLEGRSDTNNRTLETLREELNTRKKEAVVVSAESGLRDPNCVKVCGGTTRQDATSWINYGSDGVKTNVDISDCGFVTIPTLTTSIEGDGGHWLNTGDSAVYHGHLSTSGFTMYLKNSDGNTQYYARTYHWNVEWIAIGYTC